MRYIPGLFFIFVASSVFSQKKYFQQEIQYTIDVTLNDESHILRANAKINYTNHSPDTLRFIFFHLWPNAYKNDRSEFCRHQVENNETEFYFSKEDDRGFIDSIHFRINNEEVNVSEYNNLADVVLLELNQALLPGQSIEITTPFRVVLPEVFSRLGHKEQSYQISQWYPKPAVYDHKGWHPIPYLDQGEFYSEFGNFDVNITLPANYVVAATGELQNETEYKFLESRMLSKDSNLIKTIGENPASSGSFKTLNFKQSHVHDFAWFANKQFIVEKTTDTLPDGKTTDCYSFFTPKEKFVYQGSSKIIASTIHYLSTHVGAYPYKQASIVSGYLLAGGGMEYPMVTVIGKVNSKSTLQTVIIHEVAHNWFYGILGSNERQHAWMDEGITSFYESVIDKKTTRETEKKINPGYYEFGSDHLMYLLAAKQNRDQPVDFPSEEYTKLNYGGMVYSKGQNMMAHLNQYLGDSVFEKCMKRYFNEWKFKHPYPEDFRQIFVNESGKDLSRFFDEGINSTRKIDYTFKKVRKVHNTTQDGKHVYEIRVKSRTAYSAAVPVSAFSGDSLLMTQWIEYPNHNHSAMFNLNVPATKFIIDEKEYIPELRINNNHYYTTGLLHKFKFRPRIGTNLGNTRFNEIYILPSLGYNFYDGFMLGAALHNIRIPNNPFQFALAPMYSFSTKSPVGTGIIGYSFFPKKGIQKITLAVQGSSFHHNMSKLNIAKPIYNRHIKIAPSISIDFKESYMRSARNNNLTLKYYNIQNESFKYQMDVSDSLYKPSVLPGVAQHFGSAHFIHKNDRTFNPFSYELDAVGNQDFMKISLTTNLRIDYHMKNKGFYVRVFAGKFINFNTTSNPFQLRNQYLNATYSASNDFLYDETYLARSEQSGVLTQQISMREGGMKIRTPLLANPIGQNDNWLTAINLRTDLPFKIPIKLQLFLDAATYARADKLNPSGSKMIFDGGVELHLFKDVFVLYMPLVMSRDFRDYSKSMYGKKALVNNMSFALNLSKINVLKSQDVMRLINF